VLPSVLVTVHNRSLKEFKAETGIAVLPRHKGLGFLSAAMDEIGEA
jgi:hypothetical protein